MVHSVKTECSERYGERKVKNLAVPALEEVGEAVERFIGKPSHLLKPFPGDRAVVREGFAALADEVVHLPKALEPKLEHA